jgi:hypothetical protein
MAERVRGVEEIADERVDEAEQPAAPRTEVEPIAVGPSSVADEEAEGTDLLLPAERRDDLRRVWLEVQSSFIDEPQDAVRKADGLVQDVLRSVAEGFESARRGLEGDWQRGEQVNTESLRLAFRRYRALFERLLSA